MYHQCLFCSLEVRCAAHIPRMRNPRTSIHVLLRAYVPRYVARWTTTIDWRLTEPKMEFSFPSFNTSSIHIMMFTFYSWSGAKSLAYNCRESDKRAINSSTEPKKFAPNIEASYSLWEVFGQMNQNSTYFDVNWWFFHFYVVVSVDKRSKES